MAGSEKTVEVLKSQARSADHFSLEQRPVRDRRGKCLVERVATIFLWVEETLTISLLE